MTKKDKDLTKLYSKPIPKDMRIDEIKRIAEAHGCIWETGGRHPFKIVHVQSGTSIAIPYHGDTVPLMCIREIKRLIDRIREGEFQ